MATTVCHDVLIMGVSARAAASSALRGGMRPVCADLFADRDLAAACPVSRVDPARGMDGFATLAGALPPSPWFYAGGLENHPEVVERISRRHRLWGVGAEGLRRVRDPMAVAAALGGAGIPAPEVRMDARGLPRDGSWLAKPRASGGGIGVVPMEEGVGVGDEPAMYYQRRVEGPSFSAMFVGAAGRARLVGVVRQWVGGVAGRPFAYRGGIGPWRMGQGLADRLGALGDRLASAFGLVGWFGVDYVLDDGIPWPVEVNPRYTASVELHELAAGRPLLPEHRDACEGIMGPGPGDEGGDPPRVAAKWIVYARRPMVVPPGDWPDDPAGTVADIPAPGTRIGPGEPVMTLLAVEAHPRACRSRLRRLRREWATRLARLTIGD
jgi:predicted ATP-grasp superfamily ATP-dependent carboligase